jgi:hypothetical protein
MAIQQSLTDDDTGAVYATAYWRISGVTFPPGLNTAVVLVGAYPDAAAAAAQKNPIVQRRFAIAPAGYDAVFPAAAKVSEIMARAYIWLKLRAEFVGGTDV